MFAMKREDGQSKSTHKRRCRGEKMSVAGLSSRLPFRLLR